MHFIAVSKLGFQENCKKVRKGSRNQIGKSVKIFYDVKLYLFYVY